MHQLLAEWTMRKSFAGKSKEKPFRSVEDMSDILVYESWQTWAEDMG